MEEIYAKIQMTEEYLRDLRSKLEASEQNYGVGNRAVGNALGAATLPFVNAACASARAAAVSVGVPLR
jgi:hypothetical protein